MDKLLDLGTPWAEIYPGSGRLTGRLSADPDYDAFGEMTPVWTYVGNMTPTEFEKRFAWQEHDYCHSIPQWDCPFCKVEA